MIYWFIGQPGAGKTVLANALKDYLQEQNPTVLNFRIDGDDLRSLTDNKDYSKQGREKNILKAQTIAHYLHNNGYNVIVSLVAPYRNLRDNFKNKTGAKEIYVVTSDIRGREHFHSDDFEPPNDKNFCQIDTTEKSIQESFEELKIILQI